MWRALLLFALLHVPLPAQDQCQTTPVYAGCDIVFDLDPTEVAGHENPYLTVQLKGEFNSPRHRTINLNAFWDGGAKMVIRFSPTEPGEWAYRLTSNLKRFDNKIGKVTATESDNPGFIRPANVHHWQHLEGQKPHLWMGDTSYAIASISSETFRQLVDVRSAQKFTHIRGLALGIEDDTSKAFPNSDRPDPAFFKTLDERVRYMNSKGLVFDMVLGHDENHLRKLFPTWQQRDRFIRYMVSRYAPFNITWQLSQEWEEYSQGRELMQELGTLLKNADPYQHPRSTHTTETSAPLLPDGWMNYVLYQSSNDHLGAIEHQLYPVPFVNAEFGYEDSGAGKSHPHHVDVDTFRRRLWNATMNGQYPTFGNTGVYGGRKVPQDYKHLDSPGAKQMTIWFDFMANTRYWELEPYFDVDGGRAIALPGTEYIVYIEKPAGPIEVRMEKHGYDVMWMNPANGEQTPLKEFKAERYAIEPPDRTHDWILYIYRQGRKESLRSYKFESRPNLMQEIETSAAKVPFEIALPAQEELSLSKPPKYEAKLKRETRGTRSMMYLWTGEVTAEGQGFRVIATGRDGVMKFPPGMAAKLPAVMSLRLLGMNANGKVYSVDRIYRLGQ